MKLFKKVLALTLALTMAIAFCGCGSDKAAEESTITVGIAQDIDSLNNLENKEDILKLLELIMTK